MQRVAHCDDVSDDDRAGRVTGRNRLIERVKGAGPHRLVAERRVPDDCRRRRCTPARVNERVRTAARCAVPIMTTNVAAAGARLSTNDRKRSASCAVVIMTAPLRPRCVTGMDARPGAASAEETPGTISKATPACVSASASSPPRPKTNGSPPLSRTTRRPRRAARRVCG